MNDLKQLRINLNSNRNLVGQKPTKDQLKYLFDLSRKIGMYSEIHSAMGDNEFVLRYFNHRLVAPYTTIEVIEMMGQENQ